MSDVKKIATRETYGKTLVELGAEMPNLVVLDADLAGATKTGVFKKAYPDRHIIGGLGGAVAECLAEKCPTKMYRIGMRDKFGESASASELLHKYMLDGEGVYKQVKAFVEGN